MYKRHRRLVPTLFFLIFLLSWILGINYSEIAEIAITVVSISLAVYIGAAAALLGSPYAEKLKAIPDSEDRTKTSLGVLSIYLRTAGIFSVGTLVISSIYALNVNWEIALPVLNSQRMIAILPSISMFISAFSCGLFFVNILFIWLILLFLINSISKSV